MQLPTKQQLKKDVKGILIGAMFIVSILQLLLWLWIGYNILRCNFWDWCHALDVLLIIPLLISVSPSPLIVFLAILFLRSKELTRKTKIKLIVSLIVNGLGLAFLLFWLIACFIFEC